MSWTSWFRLTLCLAAVSAASMEAQAPGSEPKSNGLAPGQFIAVSEQVAALVRPILDLRTQIPEECGKPADSGSCTGGDSYSSRLTRERRTEELFYELTRKKSRAADEALVVLMCFYMGESQEEVDAVIERGRRMLPYLKKYRNRIPRIPKRSYPDSMLKEKSIRVGDFDGAIKAIHHGWKSTAENPEG